MWTLFSIARGRDVYVFHANPRSRDRSVNVGDHRIGTMNLRGRALEVSAR